MELMPWRTRQMSPISSLQSEMNRMFEDFFTRPFGFTLQGGSRAQALVPALDVKEDENSIMVTAELPGIDSKDIEISVQGDMLEIRGHKRDEQKQEQGDYHVVERCYGAFARRITLPREVDSEQAEATMNNGVLTLRLPKAEPRSGKKTITVQESSGQESMSESSDQSMSESSDQSMSESSDRSMGESSDRSMGESSDRSMGGSMGGSMGQTRE
jgi:HSP20 family protein